MWWIVGTFENMGYSFLHVYYSNRLTGPYLHTPNNCGLANCLSPTLSPFTGAHKVAGLKEVEAGIRNGGSLFIYNHTLYRLVQQQLCNRCYGDVVDLFSVLPLSFTYKYIEHVNPSFRTNMRSKRSIGSWNSQRSHHVSIQQVQHSASTADSVDSIMIAAFDGNDAPNFYDRRNMVDKDFNDYDCPIVDDV
jgi:hypothetical protein